MSSGGWAGQPWMGLIQARENRIAGEQVQTPKPAPQVGFGSENLEVQLMARCLEEFQVLTVGAW